MLEKEQEESKFKERELEEEVDFLLPYLAKLGNPKRLTYEQALRVKNQCLETFKKMLLRRANDVQQRFEKVIFYVGFLAKINFMKRFAGLVGSY